MTRADQLRQTIADFSEKMLDIINQMENCPLTIEEFMRGIDKESQAEPTPKVPAIAGAFDQLNQIFGGN